MDSPQHRAQDEDAHIQGEEGEEGQLQGDEEEAPPSISDDKSDNMEVIQVNSDEEGEQDQDPVDQGVEEDGGDSFLGGMEISPASSTSNSKGPLALNNNRMTNKQNGSVQEVSLDEDDSDVEEIIQENPDPLFNYGEEEEDENEDLDKEDSGAGGGEEDQDGDSSVDDLVGLGIEISPASPKDKSVTNGCQEEDDDAGADDSPVPAPPTVRGRATPILVNDTKALMDLSKSKEPPKGPKEPTLVIIDTNAIMAGRGAVPMKSSLNHNSSGHHNNSGGGGGNKRSPASIDIPDDAYLIEAPSFIVPYVFEQNGESSLKDTIKSVASKVKEEQAAKLAKGEELTDEDKLYEPKPLPPTGIRPGDDYFVSPVGKLLTSIGMNLVTEFVQTDLLKMQKRVGEKEKAKSRMGMMTHLTQQSIFSLKKNIDESKENNEPFRSKMKKCELCNFRTESELVMSTHQETPHMKNYSYRCNFCIFTTRVPQEIIFHMEAEHSVRGRLERAPAYHQCPNCPFEDNSKAKLTRHLLGCVKRFIPATNLEPPNEWDTPAKLPKLPKNRILPHGMNINPAFLAPSSNSNQRGMGTGGYPNSNNSMLQKQYQQGQGGGMLNMKLPPPLLHAAPNKNKPIPGLIRTNNNPRSIQNPVINPQMQRGMMMRGAGGGGQMGAHTLQMNNHMLQQVQGTTTQQMRGGGRPGGNQPSISITPLNRPGGGNSAASSSGPKPGGGAQGAGAQGGKTSFVICEICDGYIKDLDQLRNHMQWIHKVKIHPKMIYNKPPLNCQKCQFRFFTDQGLERHLLGSHGLVTSSMQDAANKGQDSGRCPLCGKVYQWKLLAHVAKDHNVTLKPAHLSYKCTVCTATFGMYKLFESHVYSAHSVTKNAPQRAPDRRPPQGQGQHQGGMGNRMSGGLQVTPRNMPMNMSSGQNNSYKPLKINDEITIIPQPMANSGLQRNKGSLTITPHGHGHLPMRRSMPARNHENDEDDGIQIIEIDDAAPHKNGVRQNANLNGNPRFSMTDQLRKRNIEISICDSGDSDDSRGVGPTKRLRLN